MKSKYVCTLIGLVNLIFFTGCSLENKMAYETFTKGESELLVCPVHILVNEESAYDSIISEKIVDYINENEYAQATTTELKPPAFITWYANEGKMLTASIDLFVAYVQQNNFPDDTYMLYVEFLKSGQEESIIGIHYCLANNEGEVAMRGLINSVWPEFQDVNPKTNEDCLAVFIAGFEGKMKK